MVTQRAAAMREQSMPNMKISAMMETEGDGELVWNERFIAAKIHYEPSVK